MTVQILHGDCRDVLRTLADASVDSVVTDPPYGLGFMGKAWDTFTPGDSAMRRRPELDAVNAGMSRQGGRQRACDDYQKRQAADMRAFQAWCEEWATECLRVLKPGGHLVAFGGTRTYHRMACAIEDAGFEVRDQLGWLYGSGFPKSLDVSKAIDKAAGAEREVIGDKLDLPGYHLNGHTGGEAFGHGLSTSTPETRMKAAQITAPATDAARQWQGWGTALKPAWEPIVLARKPLVGTVAENVLQHGTGAMNIDGCRVEGVGPSGLKPYTRSTTPEVYALGRAKAGREVTYTDHPAGRWPANLIHDGSPEVLAGFPGQEGESAARFFYCAKANKRDRDEGLEGFERKAPAVESAHSVVCAKCNRQRVNVSGACKCESPEWVRVQQTPRGNHHPTVKPTDLMRWLCRLITPPGGTVLDPFMGSGSTLKAAELEGFSAIGIELDADYIEIARRRIASDAPLFSDVRTLSPIAAVSAQDSGGVCAAPNLPEAA